VTEEITKSLDDLKESVKLKAREKEKKMIQRQLEERIDLYGIIIETDISEAKNE
jgi:polyhydroxyalkanoate synthesis regulator phasin